MTLYQGYAQQKGFDPVDIPDPSAKILAQGRDQLAGMEKALAANKQAAAQTVRDLERRAQIEQQNHDTNFTLKMGYRDLNAKARWKNFEREIKNEEIRQKNREVSRQELISLVKFVGKTGFQAAKSLEANRKADIDEMANQIYDQQGIGLKKFNQIRSIDRFIWNDATAREGVLREMDLQGVPHDILNRIRRSGGYAALRVAELSALRHARGRLGLYYDKWNTKYEIAGQQVDFTNVPQEHLDELFRQVDAEYRQGYGENYPSSNVITSSGATTVIEDARTTIRKEIFKRDEKRAKEAQYDDELEIINHQIKRNDGFGRPSGPIGIWNAMIHRAGGEDAPREKFNMARMEIVDGLVYGLKNRLIDPSEVIGFDTVPVKSRDTGEITTYAHQFKKDWAKIEPALNEAITNENVDALRGSKLRRAEDLNMLEEMTQLEVSGEEVTPQVWSKFAQVADTKGLEKTHAYIVKQIATGQNSDNDAIAQAILEERAGRHEIITDAEIDKLQMSDLGRATAKQLARKHNNYLPQAGKGGTAERLKGIITDELEDIIPRAASWDRNASHSDAAIGAFEIASSYYRTARETQSLSHEESYKYAKDLITKTIRDPDGKFAKGGPPGNRGHKGYLADTNRDLIRSDTDYLHTVLRLEPTRITSEPILAETDVRSKVTRLSKGLRTNVLPRAELVRSVTGIKHIDLLLGQREYYANKEIAEKGSTTIPEVPEWYIKEARRVENFVGPNAQRLLDTYLPSKVNQAFIESGNSVPYIEPIVNKAKPIAQQLSGGDYNSVGEVSSTEALGFSLIGSTIREVLMVAEEYPVVGAYQLSGDEIELAADKAGIAFDTKFTSETQDKLFQTLLKSGEWTPPPLLNNDQADLLSSVYNVLTKGPRNFHEDALLNPRAAQYIKEMAYATA